MTVTLSTGSTLTLTLTRRPHRGPNPEYRQHLLGDYTEAEVEYPEQVSVLI